MKTLPRHRNGSASGQTLRVLIVEDCAPDAELMVMALRKGGIEVLADVVQTRDAFLERLGATEYDVILSDYKLPRWTGMGALEEAARHGKDLPFIVVTGALGDERAAECIKLGASDYVLKEHLGRLPMAVQRSLTETRLRVEHARLEEQFRQAQKMEAIGILAGGIAHNFNNLLQIIYSYTYVASQQLSPDTPAAQALEEIKKAAGGAASLTRQLLTFSRRQDPKPQVVDLNRLIVGMSDLIKHVLKEETSLLPRLGRDLWSVRVDTGQMEQLLINLALNARDAMPGGGTFTIETANVQGEGPGGSKRAAVAPGQEVVLTVRDTGVGMDEATREHIFEPFFTTKEPGRGTGLGLATVYGIVKQSGGHITVRSEPGRGTTFEIHLPREEAAAEDYSAGAVLAEPLRGSETLLVVEDDPVLRKVIRLSLEDKGYRVLIARDGTEALEVSEANPGPIHLLVTDVIMPGMSGRALAEHLVQRQPDLKALFFSGSSLDGLRNAGVVDSGIDFLPKPFFLPDLIRKVREVLDAKETSRRD